MRWHATLCFQLARSLVTCDIPTKPLRRWLAATSVEVADVLTTHDQLATSSLVLIEPATMADIPAIQRCNHASLPENYADCFYERHLTNWPDLSFVARSGDFDNSIVGYVLGRLEDHRQVVESPEVCGHITSLAVSETFRRRGVARGLMAAVHQSMARSYSVDRSRLHVRCSNHNALRLYSSLGYTIHSVCKSYYADGEAAYLMAAKFDPPSSSSSMSLLSKQHKIKNDHSSS